MENQTKQIIIVVLILVVLYFIYQQCLNGEMFSPSKQIIYIYHTQCGHCRTFTPTWDLFAQQYSTNPHVNLIKVNAETDPAISERYNINGYPAVIAVEKGEVMARFDGPRTVSGLISFMVKFSSDHRKGKK